ncbi:hypothetical protein [Absidia glauca]|uniref:Uncharacterized protein n=1 Tax=Absidia glauca TaxID=4829 RepID=A0A168N5E0_ABSGL|nr:hypothetical protein [Absidia glauca]
MSQSPMSITQLCNTEQEQQPMDPHDPEVKLAAEALDSLGKVGKAPPITLPPISTMSTAPSTPALVTPSGSLTSARQSFSSDSTFDDDSKHIHVATVESYTIAPSTTPAAVPQQHFIRRVSNHPFVHSALRAYESSKASSPVVKYGAEMVESIASPIYGKFGRQSSLEVPAQHETHNANDDDPTTAATTALANTSISDRPTQRRAKHHSRDDSSLGKSPA